VCFLVFFLHIVFFPTLILRMQVMKTLKEYDSYFRAMLSYPYGICIYACVYFLSM
jgi:hypothetical protein